MKELYRVTKKNGLVFVVFMPRMKHILQSLMYPENWLPHNSVNAIQRFSETGCFDHADKGRFTSAFFYRVEEIEPFMQANGFEKVALLSSNIGSMLTKQQWDYWIEKGEKEMERVVELMTENAADSSLLGISSHLLYIGKKR